MTQTISDNTQRLVDLLNRHASRLDRAPDFIHLYTATPGRVYDRVVWQSGLPRNGVVDWSRTQRSVRCFVNRKTGDIHYAEGWTTPAKWKDGPAVEFRADEYREYAEFTKNNGWGYKGDRAAWEERMGMKV